MTQCLAPPSDAVRKRDVRGFALERPDTLARAGLMSTIVVPIMGVVVGAVTWSLLGSYPLWEVLLVDLGSVAIIATGIWLGAVASTNYGIVRTDHGLIVYQEVEWGGRLERSLVPWQDIREASMAGPTAVSLVRVRLAGVSLPLYLDARQARAVLSDSRLSLGRPLPPELVRRIRLAPAEAGDSRADRT